MVKNRKWMLALCAVVACLALVGCMNAGDRVTPQTEASEQPGATAQANQDGTGLNPTTAPQAEQKQGQDGFDWLGQGMLVEQKINMLSEIQSSRVLVSNGTALVGVTFANQYKGEMTQRIRDMVAGEVQSVDSSIQSVAVTANQEDVDKINEMADKVMSGTPISEVEEEISAIVRNVTTVQ